MSEFLEQLWMTLIAIFVLGFTLFALVILIVVLTPIIVAFLIFKIFVYLFAMVFGKDKKVTIFNVTVSKGACDD